jgi:hypothetical protein
MGISVEIRQLLRIYKAEPYFPFHDWHRDETCFWALRTFYDAFFHIAFGSVASQFKDVLVPRFDPTAMPFDKVLQPEPYRRVSVTPLIQGGMMLMTVREADEGYEIGQKGATGLPPRSWMSISVDFSARRLEATAQAIHTYAHAPFAGLDAEAQMGKELIDKLGPVFGRPGRRKAELSLQGDVMTYGYVPRRRVNSRT